MGQGSTPGTRGTGADEFTRAAEAGWKMQDGAGEREAEGVGWSWVQIPVQWLKIRVTNHPVCPDSGVSWNAGISVLKTDSLSQERMAGHPTF